MQRPKSFRPWEPDLERLTAEAMPRRGLARKADGTQTSKTQRNFTDANSHLMKGGGQRPSRHRGPPKRGPMPRDADTRSRMARKLRSKAGSAIDAQRKAIVEAVEACWQPERQVTGSPHHWYRLILN